MNMVGSTICFGGGDGVSPGDFAALEARVAALESVPGSTPQTYACPSGASVRDAVYISGSDAVDLADASDPAKMPAIGFIATKPTATTCTIQDEDELGGFTVPLTPGARYYISQTTPGGITTTVPSSPGVEQQAGWAKDATTLKVELGVRPEANL